MFRRSASLGRVAVEGPLSLLHEKAEPSLRYYQNAKTSGHSSRRAWFSFAWRCHGCVAILRSHAAGKRAATGPGCCFEAATRLPPMIRGNGWTSQVPAETLAAAHMLLRPRKNRTQLALTLRPTRPRVRERPWLLQLDFRGSIAWLDDSLSTLRTGTFPPGTQDSLPAAWLRSAGRGLHPLGLLKKGFSYVSESHIILLSRACLAQSRFLCVRVEYLRRITW